MFLVIVFRSAASWSPDGKHFAFAMEDRSLHFKSSTFTDGNLIKLPAKLGGDEDSPSLHGKESEISFSAQSLQVLNLFKSLCTLGVKSDPIYNDVLGRATIPDSGCLGKCSFVM